MSKPKLLKLNLQHFAAVTDAQARIEEIMLERRELALKGEASTDTEELRSINTQLGELNKELRQLKSEQETVSSPPIGRSQVLGTYGFSQQGQQANTNQVDGLKDVEQRSNLFERGRAVQFDMDESEIRSITVTNGLQNHASKSLNPGLLEVSSIVDLVKSMSLPGGESYKSSFIVSSGSAGYTAEEADYYDNQDVKNDFVSIDKAKITTYFELPEEVFKLGGNHYLNFARDAARTAIRKKIAQQILVGAGGTNSLRGIFNAPANAIPADTDVYVPSIDGTVLDKIVFDHGGDEAVEGGAYLILNKQTLAEFARFGNSNGDPFYKIKLDPSGNTGTISSRDSFQVPFVINSAVKSFQNAADGDYFMAYGKPKGYELAQFSGLEVEESKHFKFRSGQLSVRASIYVGGNTASYKGFTRIKKGTAPTV